MYRSIVNNSQSLYMDLSNGSKFNPEIDLKYQPEVCLGLRITCNLLNLPLDIFQYELKRKKIDPNIFRTHNVFKYIININIKKQIEKEQQQLQQEQEHLKEEKEKEKEQVQKEQEKEEKEKEHKKKQKQRKRRKN
ncbi:hypothetical protein M0813_17759 [Anaeramoeba flamelloides]|uniref:Uncharacterized protein n=1 Tax=Anaeramoeba flamelloides TaxID=1746091 RepID=A0ABQ8YUV8_9EUKA|nr:hypothetical protein M0813_17759 [Anaeramoeba flamelloides]